MMRPTTTRMIPKRTQISTSGNDPHGAGGRVSSAAARLRSAAWLDTAGFGWTGAASRGRRGRFLRFLAMANLAAC